MKGPMPRKSRPQDSRRTTRSPSENRRDWFVSLKTNRLGLAIDVETLEKSIPDQRRVPEKQFETGLRPLHHRLAVRPIA